MQNIENENLNTCSFDAKIVLFFWPVKIQTISVIDFYTLFVSKFIGCMQNLTSCSHFLHICYFQAKTASKCRKHQRKNGKCPSESQLK